MCIYVCKVYVIYYTLYYTYPMWPSFFIFLFSNVYHTNVLHLHKLFIYSVHKKYLQLLNKIHKYSFNNFQRFSTRNPTQILLSTTTNINICCKHLLIKHIVLKLSLVIRYSGANFKKTKLPILFKRDF